MFARARETVAADAELFISSGKILSKAEQEQRALEALIRAKMATEEIAAPTVALSCVALKAVP